jgi:hypothetical protein
MEFFLQRSSSSISLSTVIIPPGFPLAAMIPEMDCSVLHWVQSLWYSVLRCRYTVHTERQNGCYDSFIQKLSSPRVVHFCAPCQRDLALLTFGCSRCSWISLEFKDIHKQSLVTALQEVQGSLNGNIESLSDLMLSSPFQDLVRGSAHQTSTSIPAELVSSYTK